MRYPEGKRYCNTEADLHQYMLSLKLVPCPHCGRTGFLIGHGFLRGYSETEQEHVVRGRRFFCSNRHRRRGCGRTFSVLLSDVLKGFMVRANTLWNYLKKVAGGMSRRAAWEQTRKSFSRESGYRLWQRLNKAQTHIRTLLCRQRPPPASSSDEPLFQLMDHVNCVFPCASCPFSSFQGSFQSSLMG